MSTICPKSASTAPLVHQRLTDIRALCRRYNVSFDDVQIIFSVGTHNIVFDPMVGANRPVRPVQLRALIGELEMPRETLRRKLEALAVRGFLMRQGLSYFVSRWEVRNDVVCGLSPVQRLT